MNGYKHGSSAQQGFSLLEVLIALVVVVIGIMGIVALQGVFLKSASDAEKRAVAIRIAEDKIEEFRGFDGISASTASISAFEDIVSSGATGVDVDGYPSNYFSWSTSVADTVVSGADGSGIIKDITLTITWGDGAADETLTLNTLIAAVDPNLSALAGKDSVGGEEPVISHTPGETPDVVPITVGDGEVKETSKPLPEVSKFGDSNLVNFEVVTYEDTASTAKLIREDFVTVNCTCEYDLVDSSLTGSAMTPTYYTWESAENPRKAVKGTFTTKIVAYNKIGSQPAICDRCCRDHHDNFSSDPSGLSAASFAEGYDPWRPDSDFVNVSGSGWDHKHYNGTSTAVTPADGAAYLEACRFKRIDGIYYLMQDWHLVDINVMERSDLDSSTALSDYGTYVQKVVAEYVNEELDPADYYDSPASYPSVSFTTENPLLDPSITVAPGSATQLMSRSIYLEKLDAAHIAYLKSVASGGVVSTSDLFWLGDIPFYEVNTTLLSDWTDAASSADISVTSEDVVTIVDPDLDYYGTYSRGLVEAAASTASSAETVFSNSELGNTGLTSSTPTDPDDETKLLSGSMTVTLNADSSLKYFTGEIECSNDGNPGKKCDSTDFADISVALSGTPAGSCSTVELPGSKLSFSCSYTHTGSDFIGYIVFSHSGAGDFTEAVTAAPPTDITWEAPIADSWYVNSVDAATSLDVVVAIP